MNSQARTAEAVFMARDAQITLESTGQVARGIFYSVVEVPGKLECIQQRQPRTKKHLEIM